MAEQGNRKDEAVMQADPMVPGTAQIRKIAGYMSSMELLEMAAHLAEGGYDKKLFSVLSRVFTEKKGFDHILKDGMQEKVQRILSADVPVNCPERSRRIWRPRERWSRHVPRSV